MNTIETIKSMENVEFISRKQACSLASIALKEFTKRSKAAKEVDKAVWDMALAGGCPNRVYQKVVALAEKYGKTL